MIVLNQLYTKKYQFNLLSFQKTQISKIFRKN